MSENDEKCEATGSTEKEAIDPYAYTKTDVFTSEIFKVEIQNLPKFFGIKVIELKFIIHFKLIYLKLFLFL